MKDISEKIKQTKLWIERIVIGLNFCPFAKAVFDQDKIHYQVSDAQSLECCLEDLMTEVERLDQNKQIETTLLIYENALQDFDDFLETIDIANALMVERGCEGLYQLASFHPDYCFADSEQNDPENYTNRSPCPTLHILREASIEQALSHYKNPENIPENNIRLAKALGVKKIQSLLTDIQ